MDKTADAVVIGGGINGCATAYCLAKRGVKRVVLLEKGHIASGPTGRSSGVVRQHYSHETLAAMARDSVNVWQHFAEQVGGDAGFVPCGVMFLAGERDAAALGATVAMQQRIGINARIVSVDELKKLEPALHTDDLASNPMADTPTRPSPTACRRRPARGGDRAQKTLVMGSRVAGRIWAW